LDSHDFPTRVGPWCYGCDLSIVSLVSSVDDESEGSDLEWNVLDDFLRGEAQLDCAADGQFLASGPRVFGTGEQGSSIVEAVLQLSSWHVLFSNDLADLVGGFLVLGWGEDESSVRLR